MCRSAVKRNFAPKAQNSLIQYKVLQNSRNFNKSSTEQALDYFRRFTNASKHRDQCLLALSYFNIDFQEILKISVFFEIRKIEPFPGSPFSDHFWRFFFEKFYIALLLGKILVANYRIVCEVNLAPKAQNFSTDIRKSAVLDAVLEDKPAQPLPCGSYLVVNDVCGVGNPARTSFEVFRQARLTLNCTTF